MPPESSTALVPTMGRVSKPPALSADVEEFMGRAPHWMLRSGITLLACALGLLLVLSVVIKYPDTISARVSILGTQPVVEVVARQSGHLEALAVRERQIVKKGEILAIIEGPANSQAVLALSEKLERLLPEITEDSPALTVAFSPENGLGKLQEGYADFLNAYRQLHSRLADEYAEQAGALLRQQLAGKRTQIASLREQRAVTDRELTLAREKFARMQLLFERQSVSQEEVQAQELSMLQQMRADTATERALTDADIEAARMEKELRDLEHERAETLRLAREALRGQVQKLRGAIALWDAEHLLRAPADGMVAFYDFWSDQQFVTAGRQVFLIVPETSRLVGRMSVAQGGAGKIKPGQTVRIRLDDYPYKEFGLVSGTVQSVSIVAREGAHLVLVDLPHPLVTTFHRKVQFKQEMTGQGSVITEEIRLLGRILYEIRRAFVNNT